MSELALENSNPIRTKVVEVAAFLENLINTGEAQAIALAKELNATLLMDDAKARKYAKLPNEPLNVWNYPVRPFAPKGASNKVIKHIDHY